MSSSPSSSTDLSAPLVVFGASGAIGRHVVSQALRDGRRVSAYVRSPEKLGAQSSNLTVLCGELSDQASVASAVGGAHCVISALGPSLDRSASGMPLIEGTRNIIDAMDAQGVARYIGIATPSLRDPRDRPSPIGMTVPLLGARSFRAPTASCLGMSQVVIDSDAEWTIARFIRPTDGPETDAVRAGFLGGRGVGISISRADIAHFLIEQITDRRFLRAAPAISN